MAQFGEPLLPFGRWTGVSSFVGDMSQIGGGVSPFIGDGSLFREIPYGFVFPRAASEGVAGKNSPDRELAAHGKHGTSRK